MGVSGPPPTFILGNSRGGRKAPPSGIGTRRPIQNFTIHVKKLFAKFQKNRIRL